jgi:hypothetical protein
MHAGDLSVRGPSRPSIRPWLRISCQRALPTKLAPIFPPVAVRTQLVPVAKRAAATHEAFNDF